MITKKQFKRAQDLMIGIKAYRESLGFVNAAEPDRLFIHLLSGCTDTTWLKNSSAVREALKPWEDQFNSLCEGVKKSMVDALTKGIDEAEAELARIVTEEETE